VLSSELLWLAVALAVVHHHQRRVDPAPAANAVTGRALSLAE
jgi:hypothetical protein